VIRVKTKEDDYKEHTEKLKVVLLDGHKYDVDDHYGWAHGIIKDDDRHHKVRYDDPHGRDDYGDKDPRGDDYADHGDGGKDNDYGGRYDHSPWG
jgi:hypothetical protein